jgi:hypothetical protein
MAGPVGEALGDDGGRPGVAIPAVLAYNLFGKRGSASARPDSRASRTTCAS